MKTLMGPITPPPDENHPYYKKTEAGINDIEDPGIQDDMHYKATPEFPAP